MSEETNIDQVQVMPSVSQYEPAPEPAHAWPAAEAVVGKKKRNFNLSSVINGTVLRIIQEHHQSDTAKALILKTFGKAPPKELDTFEKIKEWIESEFHGVATEPVIATTAPVATATIALRLRSYEKDSGRCRYVRDRQKDTTTRVSIEQVMSILEDAGVADEDEAVQAISRHLNDTITNVEFEDGNWETISEDYNDHSGEDTEESYTEIKRESAITLREWLRANLPQEVREELGML